MWSSYAKRMVGRSVKRYLYAERSDLLRLGKQKKKSPFAKVDADRAEQTECLTSYISAGID